MGRRTRMAAIALGCLVGTGVVVFVGLTLRNERDIDAQDLVGVWYHDERGETLTLQDDGTCLQSIKLANREDPFEQSCTWTFKDGRWSPELTLRDCIVVIDEVHGTSVAGEFETHVGLCIRGVERRFLFSFGEIVLGGLDDGGWTKQ